MNKNVCKVLCYSLVLGFIFCFYNCNSKEKSTNIQANNSEYFKGQFLNYQDASIIQVQNEVYSIINNELLIQITDSIAKIKAQPEDMTEVVLKGNKKPKPQNEEGWSYQLEITEIVQIVNDSLQNK